MAPIFMLLFIFYQFLHPSSIWSTLNLKELWLKYDNPWIFHSNWLVVHINFINAFNGGYFNNQVLLPLKDVKSMLVCFFHGGIKLDMKLYNLIFFPNTNHTFSIIFNIPTIPLNTNHLLMIFTLFSLKCPSWTKIP